MSELIERREQNTDLMQQAAGYLQGMAETMRSMEARIGHLEQMLQRQELRVPVSTSQKAALNQAVAARAAEYCRDNALGAEHQRGIGTAIRRSVRAMLEESCGVHIRGMGDVPACQYSTVLLQIQLWDE